MPEHRLKNRKGNRRETRLRGDGGLIDALDANAHILRHSLGTGAIEPGAIHRGTSRPGVPLLEQTLDAAREIESFLAQQAARIALLETLTMTDDLTGLFNRRGFLEQFRRTLAACARYGDKGALMIGDLDGFKAINDTHGHLAGDMVLRQVARVIASQVRETDIVGRLGGDEFAILLVQTGWRDGERRAAMISRAINRTYVTHQGAAIPVRASFGIEPFGPKDDEATVMARADMAMYLDKQKRRQPRLRLVKGGVPQKPE